MRTLITMLLVCLWVFMSLGQIPFTVGKYDYVWRTGMASYAGLPWGGTEISYFTSPLTLTYRSVNALIARNYASICDSLGNFQCYTNGLNIYNVLDSVMDNGTGINVPEYDDYQLYPAHSIMLPKHGSENQTALLLHKDYGIFDGLYYTWQGETFWDNLWSSHLYLTTIDLSANNGLGTVVQKNELLIQDTLEEGRVNAVRHANGRDWWMPVFRSESPTYYRVLVQPDSISVLPPLEVSYYAPDYGSSIGRFTPDGTKYIRAGDANTSTVYVTIYDFDRCDGTLTFNQMFTSGSFGFPGLSVSPNSRYLYMHVGYKINQYDLWADSIGDSKIKVFEYSSNDKGFAAGHTAPDGRIYIPDGYQRPFLHSINHPDRHGVACQVAIDAVPLFGYCHLGANPAPNYRLGPLDGSACDTLGLDNYPEAKYVWDADTANHRKIRFDDLSLYNPTAWSWDFGDNATSATVAPTHIYATDGVYNVCLTVSNENASDTYCSLVTVGTSASTEVEPQEAVHVYPNPFTDALHFQTSAASPANLMLTLYDPAGREVLQQPLGKPFIHKFVLGYLAAGLYLYELKTSDGVVLQSGKVVKQ